MRDKTHNERSKRRRDRLRAAGICINGKEHGPIFKGSRCFKCWRVHKGENANMEPYIRKPKPKTLVPVVATFKFPTVKARTFTWRGFERRTDIPFLAPDAIRRGAIRRAA